MMAGDRADRCGCGRCGPVQAPTRPLVSRRKVQALGALVLVLLVAGGVRVAPVLSSALTPPTGATSTPARDRSPAVSAEEGWGRFCAEFPDAPLCPGAKR